MYTEPQNTSHSHTSPKNLSANADKEIIKHRMNTVSSHRAHIDELDAAIGKLNRTLNATSYQLLVMIREFDERAGWLRWSFPDGVSWLKWRCDISTGAAREKLRMAHALATLPLMSKSFGAGKLSYSKVRVISRLATAENEAELIDLAQRLTVKHLTEHCKRRSNAKAASIASAQTALEARSYRVWHNANRGTMHIYIELPVADGELIEQAVEKASVQIAAESGIAYAHPDDEPSWSALQADAVVHLMRESLAGASTCATSNDDQKPNSSTADQYQVMVHVDEIALTQCGPSSADDDQNPADDASSQYPIETVRRLCCDGSIVPIIENAQGEPLNVGRKVRTVTTAIRRALWARDKGCGFPGCSHTRFVDAHHIKHWADGGETSVENMVLLCSAHHRLVHEGAYSVTRTSGSDLLFRRPDGKAVPACGFCQEDWKDDDIGLEINQKNSREFFSAQVEEAGAQYELH